MILQISPCSPMLQPCKSATQQAMPVHSERRVHKILFFSTIYPGNTKIPIIPGFNCLPIRSFAASFTLIYLCACSCFRLPKKSNSYSIPAGIFTRRKQTSNTLVCYEENHFYWMFRFAQHLLRNGTTTAGI